MKIALHGVTVFVGSVSNEQGSVDVLRLAIGLGSWNDAAESAPIICLRADHKGIEVSLPFAESAVAIENIESGVVLIRMQDRASKNGFSPALCGGLIEAFARVETCEDAKVVILTGYDNYFSSGGTQAGLLQIQERNGSFSDTNVYALALECSIPVIAAMQGHAIGGGFAMGLHADLVVLGREPVYTTNFMRYGFTPGMGATYVLRRKLGIALAEEMLLAAETFRGATLQGRGVPFPVVPQRQVMAHAEAVARSVAQKPRKALQLLKRHLVAEMRAELPAAIAAEVAMHSETFHDNNVRELIQKGFGTASR